MAGSHPFVAVQSLITMFYYLLGGFIVFLIGTIVAVRRDGEKYKTDWTDVFLTFLLWPIMLVMLIGFFLDYMINIEFRRGFDKLLIRLFSTKKP